MKTHKKLRINYHFRRPNPVNHVVLNGKNGCTENLSSAR